jgi:hypothetical protein
MAMCGCVNPFAAAMMQNMGNPILAMNLRGIWRAFLKMELSMSLDIGVYVFPEILHLLTLLQKNSGPYHYPTWARMARDYLAIQGSATPPECAFSGGGITGTACCSCLTPDAFKALQILKSTYQNGHIGAPADTQIWVDNDTGDWETSVAMEVCSDDRDLS